MAPPGTSSCPHPCLPWCEVCDVTMKQHFSGRACTKLVAGHYTQTQPQKMDEIFKQYIVVYQHHTRAPSNWSWSTPVNKLFSVAHLTPSNPQVCLQDMDIPVSRAFPPFSGSLNAPGPNSGSPPPPPRRTAASAAGRPRAPWKRARRPPPRCAWDE